ncbi:PH domain-containing protein [Skermania sp. ID1734]|uniref:PH domain-containing protein n=1 Tax=Skermania sp. ID1734 TaxID=2597516 RepID=UPI00117D8EAD|nr:PH domain-containing protein [Skermania sp. ID1734]TSD99726.1 PH domain-containing protein [Skermania sp. ID1734]
MTNPQPVYDRPDQLAQIQSGLLQGETVLAVYDCIGTGTGFVALTSSRVILQDKSFVGNKVAITSVPYKNIRSVSVVSNKSFSGKFFSSGSIAIDAGSNVHVADFRGADKSRHVHDVILWHITR